jgi:hypothetical protein
VEEIMIRKTSHLAPALCCAALAGCASYHLVEPSVPPVDVASAPPAGLARVCVLRPSSEVAAVPFAVRDNDQLVGATRGASYFCYHAEPGDHHITSAAENNRSETWLTTVSGRSYYVHQHINSSFQQIDVDLRLVDEALARQDMKGRPYRMLVSAPGNEAAPAPVPLARVRPAAGDRT